jgi:hypothetical protein
MAGSAPPRSKGVATASAFGGLVSIHARPGAADPLLLTLHAVANTHSSRLYYCNSFICLVVSRWTSACCRSSDGPASHLCHPWMDAPWPRHMRRPGYSRIRHCYVHVNDRLQLYQKTTLQNRLEGQADHIFVSFDFFPLLFKGTKHPIDFCTYSEILHKKI